MKRKVISGILAMTLALILPLSVAAERVDSVTVINPKNMITSNESEWDDIRDEIFKLTNEERVNAGAGELERYESLDIVALQRAKEQAMVFGHTRPDGTSWLTAIDNAKIPYQYVGENVGYITNGSASQAVDNWMNSEGHRKTMLRDRYTHMGIGVYEDGNYVFFVQLFMTEKK